MKTLEQILEGKDFEPHMMYDPKTGKGYKAEKPEDHERMKKMGYSHEKPEVKEDLKEEMISYRVKKMQKPEEDKFQKSAKMMGLKYTSNKGRDDTVIVISGTKKKLRDFDSVVRGKSSYGDPSTIKHFDEGSFWGQDKMAKSIDKKMSKTHVRLTRDSKGGYERATIPKKDKKKIAQMKKDGYKIDPTFSKESLDEQHQEALDMLQENYRTLARKGMGTETKKDARVGLELDFYETERGDKVFGKIIKVTGTGYTVQAMERGNSKKYTFKFHDRAKAKKLLEARDFMENYRAKRDAMRDMPKRGKDSADDDIEANDDDRKAASKNVLMQIRKASDLPKGGPIEFEGGKKGKISQDDAKKISKLFDILKKPSDKQKFQKVISKDLRSIQALLKRLGK
jgi:hypothetical protein